MFQIPLPARYAEMSSEEAAALIAERKKQLAGQVVLLGHHYQRDEIIQFADYTGDSLELSRLAAKQEAEYIVFCGVHFMAESADILTGERQKVILPDMTAGCSMADMADLEQVLECWEDLAERMGGAERLVPVCYVNSTAAIKAFCGEQGGLCCTSSNCRAVLESIYQRRGDAVVLFLPDEHLGRNTGWAMGFGLEAMAVWDPFAMGGGVGDESLERAKMVLWKGFCSVHQEFTVEQVREARRENPKIQIMVHPECCFEVAQAADFVGSTSQILQRVRAAEAGSSWALGTEINLVNRLAAEMAVRGTAVRCLSSTVCLCETMYRIDPAHLAWVMDMIAAHILNPAQNKLYNQVIVDPQTKAKARIALEKMLAVASPAPGGGKS